jgi:methyltransferase (TIGR00027 family)
MRDDQASYTAEGSAFARAAGAQHADPKLRNPDHLAVWMLGPTFRRRALPGVWRISQRVMQSLAPGAFFIHQARTRYFDGLVKDAVRGGAKQLVLLGAGFDTRAHRFADLFERAGVTVFEVDHPATSATKQERVARSLGGPPPNVRYVTVDFARERAADRLDAHRDFDRGAMTFFLWEGVSAYLNREALDATVDLAARAAFGSAIAFDYHYADSIAHPDRWAGMERMMRTVEKRGEPMTFGVDPGDLAGVVAARGLDLEENVLPDEAERRFLVGSSGALWGRLPPAYAMAVGRKRRGSDAAAA